MRTYRAIGLMSGTSMDGVDVALIETDGHAAVRQGPSSFLPYHDDDRALLRAGLSEARDLTDRDARPGVLAACEALITERHGEAVEAFMAANGLAPADVDIVGFHGQTMLHRPERRLTVQIGDGVALADRLGVRVAFDFRAADVAAGGQGAPLVPVYHQALVEAAGLAEPVGVLNVGGVANLTFVQPGLPPIACDTGPGNALIDDLMLERTGRAVDLDGEVAAHGRADATVLAGLLAHPFFDVVPPKSLDRNDFSRDLISHLSLEDAAATLTAFTAAGVARLLPLLPTAPMRVVVCGGGTRNPTLMRTLAEYLRCPVVAAEAQGWSADAMEAQAFAYLAVRTLEGLPLTFPTSTGVPRPMPGGRIAQPRAADSFRLRRAG